METESFALVRILYELVHPLLFWGLLVSFVAFMVGIKIREVWRDIAPWERAYRREKSLLEIAKLRHEIEALKSQHGREDLGPSIPSYLEDLYNKTKSEYKDDNTFDQIPLGYAFRHPLKPGLDHESRVMVVKWTLFFVLFNFLLLIAIVAFFVPRSILEKVMWRIEWCLPKAGRTSLAYAVVVGFVISALVLALLIGGLFLGMKLEE